MTFSEVLVSVCHKVSWLITYFSSRLKRLLAPTTGETLLMKGLAHCLHHFALNVVIADGTLGAEEQLIVGNAVVVAIFGEKSPNGQGLFALFALKTALVKVLFSDPQYFAGTLFLARRADNFRFTCK